jgi:SNF2 family DNA or RNA helicase
LALTGTPMENNLEELWCLFDWLIPGLLGNRKKFAETFRKPIEKEQNLSRQAILSKRIAPFLLRRTKDQVVTDLPSRTEIIQTVQLAGPQRALYETVRATMHDRVREALSKKGLASSKITVLDALLKLRQVCCDPQLVKLPSARKVTTSAKRAHLLEMLESLIAEGRRVLVFSQFVEMLRLIETDIKTQGWDYLMLTGQTQKRGELVDAFQSGKAAVFLISLKAGGVGLNLTAADTVILYDPWWNPAIERQAMDRVHRIGQDKPVFVHRLIAEGTVETRIAQMQARKQALMDSVFDPEATATIDMSEQEILSLFAPVRD